jgi:type III pantothenate kinase
MILALDVGNSNITVGAYNENELIFTARLKTDKLRTENQYAIELLDILKLYIKDFSFSGAIISSVVPELTESIRSAVVDITAVEPIIIGPGIKTGLNIASNNAAEIGADLIAGAVGTFTKYPLPAIVIDLGTATKIYVVSDKKEFVGGMIAPGIRISMDALSKECSQLPTVSLNTPKKAISLNTTESMQSGIVFGFAAMIDGMLKRYINEYGQVKTIVATGGLSKPIIKNCENDILLDENLILDGLRAIYSKNA